MWPNVQPRTIPLAGANIVRGFKDKAKRNMENEDLVILAICGWFDGD